MKRIFTNGCFDILHSGHINTLEEARKLGDRLIVGVNSDESVCSLKGTGRPLVPLKDRMAILRAVRSVDEVVPFWESTPQKLIEAIRPDVIVKGSDWRNKPVAGANVSEVAFIQNINGFSTTEIVRRIIALYKAGILDEDGRSK